MKFKPSLAAEEFIESVYPRVGARNKAVLGRSALFLAIGEGVPLGFKPKDSQGKDLDDAQVVGDDLKDLVRAALNCRAGVTLTESAYTYQFRAHFEYGCFRLRQIWEDSGNDQVNFVSNLLKLADGASAVGELGNLRTAATGSVGDEVQLSLLKDVDSWSLNGSETKNGLLVISGEPGSGKSQLALDLLSQLSRQNTRFLFFDLKGELEPADGDPVKAQNRMTFFDQTGAQYVRLIDSSLPINPLYRGTTRPETANISARIASLVRAYGPQMGANQENEIATAYAQLKSPDFPSLLSTLISNGAKGVSVSIIKKIAELNIFSDSQNSIPFDQWIKRSIVIDFKKLDNDTRSLAVAFILNFFIERLSRNLSVQNGVQPLQMVLFIDEAHNILPRDSRAKLIEKLAREGRSWGFPLWLASQDANKFLTSTVDFAELSSAGIHFSPHTLKQNEQRQVLGNVLPRALDKGEAVLRIRGNLELGTARQFWRDRGKEA